MDIRVVSIRPTVGDENKLSRVSNSVKLAGQKLEVQPEESAVKSVSDGDYGHILTLNTIIMPDFYSCMIATCEHGSFDFVYCPCVRLKGDEPSIVFPTPADFTLGQILVKSWVLRELGADVPRVVLARVLAEYRGVEVPHNLCMETN